MKTNWKALVLAGALLTGLSGTAAARDHVSFSLSFGVPAYTYAPPRPVYYAPAPVYYDYASAPAYYDYAPPPVVYYAPPPRVVYYGPHHRHWHHRSW